MKMTSRLGAVAFSALAFAFVAGSPLDRLEAAPAPARDATLRADAKVDAENYVIEIKGGGAYKAGKEGTVEVTLASKGGYHLNDKYPMKFKLSDPAPEGVSFPKPILRREDGKFEQTKGSFTVPFVAAKAGKAKVAGVLSFSVCSDQNCLMEKKDLELTVDVK